MTDKRALALTTGASSGIGLQRAEHTVLADRAKAAGHRAVDQPGSGESRAGQAPPGAGGVRRAAR